jgi:hypothetical protein
MQNRITSSFLGQILFGASKHLFSRDENQGRNWEHQLIAWRETASEERFLKPLLEKGEEVFF